MRQKYHKEKIFTEYGRISQKLKTREKLLIKANEMLKMGDPISVESVAVAAGISKATAYRYFSSTEVLKREASLQVKAETADNLFADLGADDLKGRLSRLIDYHYNLFLNNEKEFRLFLSSTISESVTSKNPPSRGSRRVVLIEEALAPLKGSVNKSTFKRMVASLCIVFGIESITVLKDICHQSNAEILATWKFLVEKLVNQSPNQRGPSGTKRRRR